MMKRKTGTGKVRLAACMAAALVAVSCVLTFPSLVRADEGEAAVRLDAAVVDYSASADASEPDSTGDAGTPGSLDVSGDADGSANVPVGAGSSSPSENPDDPAIADVPDNAGNPDNPGIDTDVDGDTDSDNAGIPANDVAATVDAAGLDGVIDSDASEAADNDGTPDVSDNAADPDAADPDAGPDPDATYALRVLVKADAGALREGEAVLGEHEGVFLLGYADLDSMFEALGYYAQVAAWCEPDIPMGASEGEAPVGGLAPVGAEDNALALLEVAEGEGAGGSSAVAASAGKPLVALVDTGAPADPAVVGAVSVIGGDPADANGHATAVLAAMKGEDPDVRVLSVKALDDAGAGSASSVYAAIEYAVGAGADIVNLSLSGVSSAGNAAVADAVADALAAGVVVVVSAGNGGYDAAYFTPANVPGALTVGACGADGGPLPDSNRGGAVDLYAEAGSTSLAAARVTGWLSADGAHGGWRERLEAAPFAHAGDGGAGRELDDELSDLDQLYSTANTYTITLDDNGGSGGGGTVYGSSSKAYLDSGLSRQITTSSNAVAVPSRSGGYTFQGYWNTATGTTRYLTYRGYSSFSSTSKNWNANKTLYAQWVKVTLNDNGGSGGQGYIYPVYQVGIYRNAALSQSMTTSSNPVTVPTRGDGYVFQGYYPNTTSSGNKRIDYRGYIASNTNTTFNHTGDVTLYAQWLRIVLDDTGGSGGNGNIYFVDGVGAYRDAAQTQKMTTTSNALPIPTKPGYVFQGYYTTNAASGGTQRVKADGHIASNSATIFNSYDGTVTLYARWKVAPWRITLDKQGGTGGQNEIWEMNSVGVYHDQDMTTKISSSAPVSLPSKPYQTFMGYYKNQYASGGQCITNAGVINTNNFGANTFKYDATIYAGWKGIKVTLNMPGGGSRNGGPATIYEMYNENWNTNQYGSTPITSIPVPTRSNYTYMGYYTGQNGTGTQIIDETGQFVVPTTYFRSDTTIYCYWAPENYVVTLDPQGADITVGTPKLWTVYNQGIYTDIQFTNAVSTTVPITVPQRAGYVFQGYFNTTQTSETATRGTRYINANGTLTNYLTKSNRKTMTLYAQWKIAPHIVYLDHQGGSGGQPLVYEMKSVGVAHDYDMTRKVSYSGSTGTKKNPVAAPYKPYQKFNGYYSERFGRGNHLLTANGYRTKTFNGGYFATDATIYAYWTGFTITFNRQSGSGGPGNMYSFYNEKYTSDNHGATTITSITPPRRTYFTFMGYYTQPNGAGTQVVDQDGNIVAPTTLFTSNATVYAYWQPENYVITLDSNGADPGFEGSSAVYALYNTGVYSDPGFTSIMNSTTNPITVPVKTGFVFRGYHVSKDSNGNGYGTTRLDNDGFVKFTPTTYKQNATLYARWLPEPFTITLDDQAGTGGSGAVYELYTDGVYRDFACKRLMSGAAYPVAVPTKADRVFAGYWTEPDGGGSIKINERGYRQNFVNTYFTSDDTIYAFWRGYAITLNDQGGRGGSGTIYEHYAVDFYADMRETTPIASVAVPTKGNYEFQGYFTAAGGAGVRLIDENGNYDPVMTNTYFTADTTLYAYWTPAVYKIELDNQGADAGFEGTDAVYEQYGVGVFNDAALANSMTTTINPITVPQKQYFKFGGYYTGQNGTGAKRIDENGYRVSSFTTKTYQRDSTLYAYWKPLTITLDDQGGRGGSGQVYENYGDAFYRNLNLTNKMTASTNRVAIPTKFNQRFLGYYTQPGGAGTCVIDSTGHLASGAGPTMFTDDATVYAHWEFHLDLPITGGEGDLSPLPWVAVGGILAGGVTVVRRRLQEDAAEEAALAAGLDAGGDGPDGGPGGPDGGRNPEGDGARG